MKKTNEKERPILFSSPMVTAILEGRKTMTRRVVKPQPKTERLGYMAVDGGALQCGADYPDGDDDFVRCPYGKPGDRLWVREKVALCMPKDEFPRGIAYWATDADRCSPHIKWRPSIRMPRVASRITLEITNVRVERLQSISTEDIIAEGFSNNYREQRAVDDLNDQFHALWEEVNGKKHPWTSNPWLWAIEFQKVEPK